MKLFSILIIALILTSVVIADDEAIKNHIDQRMRELKADTISEIDSRTNNVTTDLKTFVGAKTDDIRAALLGEVVGAVRSLIFAVVGSFLTVLGLWHFLNRLKDKKTRGLMQKRVVPNVTEPPKPPPKEEPKKVDTEIVYGGVQYGTE